MNVDHIKRNDCRLCHSKTLDLAFKLNPTPPANAFLAKENLNKEEKRYPLDLYLCSDCGHLQLLDVVNPEILFSNYVYVSGTSPVFIEHFRLLSEKIIQLKSLNSKDFVIDIGSNDGTLLKFFKEKQIKILGIDPAVKIANEATARGIPTLTQFFDEKLAEKIKIENGLASVIMANNVFAHIDDLDSVTKGVSNLLNADGIFVFEVSYLRDVIENNLFDTIYHEHLCYHSLKPLKKYFERFGLELFDAERVSSHGGSIRCFVQKKFGKFNVSNELNHLIKYEEENGFFKLDTYKKYFQNIKKIGSELKSLLDDLIKNGKKIAGFGAPAKATTLMHQFELNAQYMSYIIDDSPWKQNLYTPGLHVPVLSAEVLKNNPPDYLLILAWNFADPIIKKSTEFKNNGGKFIVPLPKLILS